MNDKKLLLLIISVALGFLAWLVPVVTFKIDLLIASQTVKISALEVLEFCFSGAEASGELEGILGSSLLSSEMVTYVTLLLILMVSVILIPIGYMIYIPIHYKSSKEKIRRRAASYCCSTLLSTAICHLLAALVFLAMSKKLGSFLGTDEVLKINILPNILLLAVGIASFIGSRKLLTKFEEE